MVGESGRVWVRVAWYEDVSLGGEAGERARLPPRSSTGKGEEERLPANQDQDRKISGSGKQEKERLPQNINRQEQKHGSGSGKRVEIKDQQDREQGSGAGWENLVIKKTSDDGETTVT